MDFQTPLEALTVLGLNEHATRDDIKSAYHRLVAVYHPDASGEGEPDTTEYFITIQSAYEYLIEEYNKAYNRYFGINEPDTGEVSPAAPSAKAPRIIGNKAAMQRAAVNRHFNEERLKQERRAERDRIKRKKAFKQRQSEFEEDRRYEEAMAKIHAIRAAEITLQLYEASLAGALGIDPKGAKGSLE